MAKEPRRCGGGTGPPGARPTRRRVLAGLGALLVPALPVPPPARADEGAGGAAGLGPETKLPLPRFVSLGSAEVNVRRGPGLAYRKDWVYRRRGLPVRIIDEYGQWRRIVDSDGAGGWVYHALLSGRRTVVVTADMATLRARPGPEAPPVARAEQGVVARLGECVAGWCEIDADEAEGWVSVSDVWGAGAR
jgi:SH3-like domain-containing protein